MKNLHGNCTQSNLLFMVSAKTVKSKSPKHYTSVSCKRVMIYPNVSFSYMFTSKRHFLLSSMGTYRN